MSAAASDAQTDCKCDAGYTGADGGPCAACLADAYKPAAGSAACAQCPASSSSLPASTSPGDCKCHAGYTGADGDVCSACAPDTFKAAPGDAACASCPASSVSEPASDAQTDCLCGLGYSGLDGGPCAACPARKYKAELGAATCTGCPASSSSLPASTAPADCKCHAGYTGADGSACAACAEGKYKAEPGSAACASCPADAASQAASDALTDCLCAAGFAGGAGETCVPCAPGAFEAGDACQQCPANRVSPARSAGASACQCKPGYSGPDGGPCSACAGSTYKTATGSAQCTDCATNSGHELTGQTAITACLCKAGFELPMTTPGTCPGGQFVPFTGDSSCSTCANNRFFNESKLFEIESRVNSLAEVSTSSEFFSHAPFLYVEGMQCQTDLIGLYYMSSVNDQTNMPIYKKLVANTVDQQTGNSLIQMMFAGGIWLCYDFRAGFSVALKSTQWSLCTGAGCPADAKNPSSVASWTELCASEFVQNSEITMTPSYYLITDALKISPFSMCQQLRLDVLYEGSESCIPQFLHVSYGCTASSHWKGASGVFWLLNVQGLMEPEYTRTISGYTFYERRLVLKREESSPNVFRWYLRLSVLLNYEETYYLLGESDDTLQNWVFKCYPATFLVVPSQAHLTTTTVVGVSNSNPLLPGVAMDPNAQSVTLLTHETCSATSSTTSAAGFACAPCAADTYKNSTANAACAPCTPHSSAPAGARNVSMCRCDAEYVAAGDGSCDRVCAAGFEAAGGADGETECAGCASGTFKRERGDDACTPCPAHAFSTARNETSVYSCLCEAGYRWTADSSGVACVRCAAGTFNSLVNATECYTCDRGPTTATTCPQLLRAPAGFEAWLGGIRACPANHFQDGTSNECTPCPAPSTYSAAGRLTSARECVCAAGYTRPADGVCVACGLGSYKDSSGDSPCTVCTANAQTLLPSRTSAAACLCSPDFEGQGGLCAACPEGTRKLSISNTDRCVQCPPRSTLLSPAPHLSEKCACNPGYYNSSVAQELSDCQPCAAGSYADAYGTRTCTACPLLSSSPPAASSRGQCQCIAFHESSQNGGPEIGRPCVASCGPGRWGTHGACFPCAKGSFKSNVGSECSTCPGYRAASRESATSAGQCVCPSKQIGIRKTKMAVIDRLGAWDTTDTLLRVSGQELSVAAQELVHDTARGSPALYQLVVRGATNLTVHIDNYLAFQCRAWHKCSDLTVSLRGARGRVRALSGGGRMELHVFKRRQAIMRSGYIALDAVALDQLGRWVAEGRLRPGDAVFNSKTVFDSTVCEACPRGLKCTQA